MSNYTEVPAPHLLNISQGARKLKTSHQRFSRALRALEIPVARNGSVILIPVNSLAQVGEYLKGRSKKKSGNRERQ